MKKLLSILLSTFMVLTVSSINVFAEGTTGSDSLNADDKTSDNINVYANVTSSTNTDGDQFDENNPGKVSDIVYDVEVSWTTTNGVASTTATNYTWDPSTMSYVAKTEIEEGSIDLTSDASAEITITNKSNAKISYTIAFTSDNGKNISEAPVSDTDLKEGTVDKPTYDTASSKYKANAVTYHGTVTKAEEDSLFTGTPDEDGKVLLGHYNVTIKTVFTINLIASGSGRVIESFTVTEGETWNDLLAANPSKFYKYSPTNIPIYYKLNGSNTEISLEKTRVNHVNAYSAIGNRDYYIFDWYGNTVN